MSINRQEYARRRQELMGIMGPNSIAILPAAPEHIRNRDVEYPYRPSSDFWYLTGFEEPEAVMVLMPGREHGEYVMFCRERDRTMEIWNGYRSGPEGVVNDFDADDAFPIGDIDEILPGLIEGRERVYYDLGMDAEFDRRLMGWVNSIRDRVRSGAQPPGEFVALAHHLHDMRLFKSAAEIKLMRKAASISAGAHVRAMQAVQPGMMEYQLEAEYIHEFMRHGSRSPAYPSIVGGGANGCILHYIDNRQKLKDGDLVLVDAGCELEMYASDITRTFPVNGKFSKPQQALYELVLASQYAAIEATHPDNHWNVPHEQVVNILTQGLLDLGLLKGDFNELVETEGYRRFFMHRTGHWLGLDVHDVGDYRVQDQWRQLEPGMALTVEPGLYVAPDDDTVDEQWRGIGIRIEDDVVVTKDGCEVLTHEVPKDVADIERVMKGS
ncbi:Xaa-Pro aminopeptidase [Alcanivorax sediminis]|uniref:Xaa-Pro aminopeptidase n=1 Tax=Alcanivorax sediminis TaxID=2663008 RepID=A0A6N7LP35_9GAMM|nr:Xaa-Pro aminopeptidase [Alcanivorax sediminis]MQX51897.1 Xaa-Pro aminopeptidase [Alcanivorax sediminis]